MTAVTGQGVAQKSPPREIEGDGHLGKHEAEAGVWVIAVAKPGGKVMRKSW